MNKFVLFIRDHGAKDVLDFHADEASAHKALAAYVTQKTGRDLPTDADAAAEAIAAYFDPARTFYTIAGIPAGTR
ncbi:hypothetical protein [Sphingomonas sp. CFBP 8760]|uniref:hypothetical protein n=1 Tax=Sphingomonas sp. CFBP 8760 TaxID=2775282 RepID=UPI00177EC12C|nr:hypothetical protein [Sphingomonas sp. CFBP 8760]MBD8546907.1 hypothetical protein [Sphingomonas sp. CFBP 8760]